MSRLLLAACLLVLHPSAEVSAGEEVQVVLSGKYRDPISAYKVGPGYFLNAKDVAALYGGQVYWFPVAGRVELSFRGKRIQFLVNSEKAWAGDHKFVMDAKVMSRAGAALLPLSILTTEDFSAWIGLDASFNPKTRLLTIDPRSSVGAVRWFSYPDKTRVELTLSKNLTYNLNRKGLKGVEVTVPLGVIEASEKAEVADGIVEDYTLRQDAKVARLSVSLRSPASVWQGHIEEGPRRLVLDIYREGRGMPAGKRTAVTSGKIAVRQQAPPGGEEGESEQAKTPPAVSTRTGVAPVLPPVATAQGKPKRRIVIDAGHGGKDSGATGKRGTYEKDINLQAAVELAKLLRDEDAFEVLLTRTDDTFVPLGDRSRMSNEFNADLFVSLHCNASTNRKESGFEVYFLSEKGSDPEADRLAEFENSVVKLEGDSVVEDGAARVLVAMAKTEHINESSELAGLMARSVTKRIDIPNRGVKQADFSVLRGADAPAILFEMAFVTNGKDETKLESSKYRRRIVEGIYAGLLDYAKSKEWLAEDE